MKSSEKFNDKMKPVFDFSIGYQSNEVRLDRWLFQQTFGASDSAKRSIHVRRSFSGDVGVYLIRADRGTDRAGTIGSLPDEEEEEEEMY